MARKRTAWRVAFDDGLDQIIEIGPPPFSLKDLPMVLLERKGSVQQHEMIAFWIDAAAALPAGCKPLPFTVEWYAQRIVSRLTRLQMFEQRHPEFKWVVFEAIYAGWDMADAFWRLNRGPQTRTGTKQRARAPAAGRKSGKARKQLAKPRLEAVEDTARTIRAAHPKTDKLSTKRLAEQIAERHGFKAETVRRDLRTLGLK